MEKMNNVVLIGRMVRDPEVKYSQNGKAVCRFTIAVDRQQEGADFISCVCFDRQAENLSRYIKKGRQIAVAGSIRTGSYEGKNGKVYTTDVYANSIEYLGSEQNRERPEEPVFQDVDDELPW